MDMYMVNVRDSACSIVSSDSQRARANCSRRHASHASTSCKTLTTNHSKSCNNIVIVIKKQHCNHAASFSSNIYDTALDVNCIIICMCSLLAIQLYRLKHWRLSNFFYRHRRHKPLLHLRFDSVQNTNGQASSNSISPSSSIIHCCNSD